MSYAPLNNVTTQNAYTQATTLLCPGAMRVNLDVYGAPIYYQMGIGVGGIQWLDETYLAPAFRSFDRLVDAVRVRSAVAGQPATVTAEAVAGAYLPGQRARRPGDLGA